jgi:hypothetical protein
LGLRFGNFSLAWDLEATGFILYLAPVTGDFGIKKLLDISIPNLKWLILWEK